MVWSNLYWTLLVSGMSTLVVPLTIPGPYRYIKPSWAIYQVYYTSRLHHTPVTSLVGGFNPSKKYESQLGWWHSQYMESQKRCSNPPTRSSLFIVVNGHGSNTGHQWTHYPYFAGFMILTHTGIVITNEPSCICVCAYLVRCVASIIRQGFLSTLD